MLNFDYINNLNEAQKEAVTHLDGPLLIVAGAGSGKTKVLTSRICHIILSEKVSPNQILAVTFTNKAANEMLSRVLHNLKKKKFGMPWVGTFHSICVKILRKHARAANLNYNFTILDQDDQKKLIKNICKSENVDTKKISPNYILNIIEKWKNKGWYPNDVILRKSEKLEESFLKIYEIYQSKLIDLNACDFNDLILHCIKIFEKNPDITKMYSKNFKYILVDEYQDTNFIQSKWLNLLAAENKNICCVGDDDQSIYSWRGAEIKNFLEFDKIYKNILKNNKCEYEYLGWEFFYSITFNYPKLIKDTTTEKKLNMIQFFDSLNDVIVCTKFKKCYKQYYKSNPIKNHLKNRGTVTKWLYNLHCIIDKNLKLDNYYNLCKKYKKVMVKTCKKKTCLLNNKSKSSKKSKKI